ncbi:MAG: plasmid replication protein RepC [Shinella sp.]|uniref:plasmid replication protein RepC n=2 Tax=Shinella sp. TaxID=1870904 RepID=UPI0040364259
MQSGSVTTPFGRRSMTLALVKSQFNTPDITRGKSIDKWKVYRDACEARSLLGLKDRALAVLHALLSFYPETDLRDKANLIVFPSNAQLTARANGIAGTTLRENLALLTQAGLIHRNDSPNGKRYARKARDGSIETAYGFSLAPLLARSGELAQLAQQVAEDTRRLKLIKERITITRRDVRKLISAAMDEGTPGDWEMVESYYVTTVGGLRSAKTLQALAECLDDLVLIRSEVINMLENQIIPEKSVTNDNDIRQHKQNSNTESIIESEPGYRKEQGGSVGANIERRPVQTPSFPLGMVLRACPEIVMYAQNGTVGGWRDLMSAAIIARSALGIGSSVYQQACEAVGGENAAVLVACILERAEHINSAGAYLRDLTEKARRGEFSLGPMLMALLRSQSDNNRQAG